MVCFFQKGDQHHDESVTVKTESVVQMISSLLKVIFIKKIENKKIVIQDHRNPQQNLTIFKWV